MLETFTLDTFSQRLNSKFTIKLGTAGALELELVEAQDIGSTPNHEQFSIIFRGPRETFLEQATYQMEHGELGSFMLFIVPVRQDKDGLYYEAIFNRPR